MKEIRINLLDVPTLESRTPRVKVARMRLPLPYVAAMTGVFFILAGTSVFSYQISQNEDSGLNKTIRAISDFGQLAVHQKHLKGESQDRINIALLGIGGEGHDGGQLTDTIIILSIQPSTHRASLISVPRDLLVNIDGYGFRKINHANAFGEQRDSGNGGDFTQKVLTQTFGLSVPYHVRVDFKAFKEIVDIVGGVDVNVDNSFTDYTYPIDDAQGNVTTISFKAGLQVMDGVRALQYGRSRHSGMNNEGSDFARSKRQQKLLVALKEKILSSETLLKPQKIAEIATTLSNHVSTNFQAWEMVRLLDIIKEVDTDNLGRITLDDGPDGLLYADNVGGAYVLQPRGGSFDTINQKIAQIFNETPVTIDAAPRKPKIIVKNGTTTAGLAGRTAETLKTKGFTVLSFSNASIQNQERTVIYTLSKNISDEQKQSLRAQLNYAPLIDNEGAEQDSQKTYADFMIVIGQDLAR